VTFATLNDPSSGRSLKIVTTKPGVQIFTANSFKGEPFPKWGGICFETQFYPDTPNQPGFPTSLLRPGETYRHTTEFHFGITD
jgi:aldose 1-epimerase